MKRSELKPGTKGFKRTRLVVNVPPQHGWSASLGTKRSTPIKPVSDKRRSGAPSRDVIRRTVFARDKGCQFIAFIDRAYSRLDPTTIRVLHRHLACHGERTPHHLLKASAGGEYTEENLVELCVFHNDWVEDYPLEAAAIGLVIR